MKIVLVGYPGSQIIVPASKYLTSKYLPGFEITYLNYTGHINGWAGYLADYFFKMEDERVIFALDDYLVASEINMKLYRDAESYLNSPEIACVKLCKCTIQEHKEYPCTTQYTLWKRTELIELLQQVRTPWEFEIEGSKLMKKASLLETCINYFANSSLSSRWDGINLEGLKQEDIKYMRETGLLPSPHYQKESSKNTLVMGGSGFLGNALIERLLSMGRQNIVSMARNEGEQVALKQKFPEVQIIIGDICNPWDVKRAMMCADEVFLLSAMKHVGLAEAQVQACVNTNIFGTMNVINESLITKPGTLVFISSDKAATPNGVYGSSKLIGERLMAEAERSNPNTQYRVVRYGNVLYSTGSVLCKWRDKMIAGEEVIVTNPDSTRFYWPINEAVDLIFESINNHSDSKPVVTPMKSMRLGDLLEAMMRKYGVVPVKTIGLQPGENMHEVIAEGIPDSFHAERFTKEEILQFI